MPHDRSLSQLNGRFTEKHNWLEIVLLILVVLVVCALAYHAVTNQGRNRAAKIAPIETSGDQKKMLFNTQ